MRTLFVLLSLLIGVLGTQVIEGPACFAEMLEVSVQDLEQLTLPGTDGAPVSLLSDADYQVLCFLGTECPLARIYGPRLQKLAERFEKSGVRFVGVNSNVQDSMEDLEQYARDHGLTFPNCKDFDRSAALLLQVTRTPEVVVIDPLGVVHYRGRIDDQYQPGIARAEATEHHLASALENLVAGRPVTVANTQPVGCLIALPSSTPQGAADVTYCNQIARVLQRNCIECHRAGEIGPFALDDYDEVVGWSAMMVEVVDDARMPPWHANPDHGSFANARHMPESDKQLLRDWLAAGTPYGDVNRLPPPMEFVSGWRLPKAPDAVFEMRQEPFTVPADGIVEYQYFVVDTQFTEDKWVRAAEVIPGNAAVVHHAIAFIRPPDGRSMNGLGMLSAYVPGQTLSPLPNGYARRVAAGSRIVFQMHYTPNGREQTDKTRIGLVFADDKDVTHEVMATGGIEQEFEIPPLVANHVVEGKIFRFPANGELLSITPHMHLRGKAFQLIAESNSGSELLLDVPHYDFNWQHNYELAQPLDLSDVKELRFKATFDNSPENPTNPSPTEYVTWGDQTWQEMAVTFAAVARPRVDAHASLASQRAASSADRPIRAAADKQRAKAMAEAQNEAISARAETFAADYITRFDANSDGHLTPRELPHSVRIFFRGIDRNRDSVITKAEVKQTASERFRAE